MPVLVDSPDVDERAKYAQKDRDSMAKSGQAMQDGSYPIKDAEDLSNAIHAVGRGGASHDSIRKHIIARAKALGLSSKIPDNWNSDGSLKTTNAAPDVKVTREPLTYEETRSDVSFFADMARSALRNDPAAAARLERHEREMAIETRVNPSTTTGQGGEFAPPLWAINQFATVARAGRTLGDLVNNLVLPPGVSSVHIPKMTTGADAQIQVAQGEPAADVDQITADAGSSTNVVTIAGTEVASMQLLEQTPPPGYDGITYRDLSLAYNQTLEKQMLAGTGTNGQLTGLTNVSGIGSVSGSGVPASQNSMAASLWPLMGQALAIIGNNRQLPPEVMLMAPRRYYGIASALDNSSRPLVTPGNPPHPNDMPQAGGAWPVGCFPGVPCYLSGGIIGTTSTAADYIVAARVSDMDLYETTPKFTVGFNSVSGTLQCRLALHRHVAFINLKPASIAVVTSIPQPTNF